MNKIHIQGDIQLETGLEYFSGIDPEIGKKGDVLESMAWKRNLNKKEFIKAVYA